MPLNYIKGLLSQVQSFFCLFDQWIQFLNRWYCADKGFAYFKQKQTCPINSKTHFIFDKILTFVYKITKPHNCIYSIFHFLSQDNYFMKLLRRAEEIVKTSFKCSWHNFLKHKSYCKISRQIHDPILFTFLRSIIKKASYTIINHYYYFSQWQFSNCMWFVEL